MMLVNFPFGTLQRTLGKDVVRNFIGLRPQSVVHAIILVGC